MLPVATPQAAVLRAPWVPQPTLQALQQSLQITTDCWNLLSAPDGSSRKQHYLPQGEPASAYRKRLEAARPSGFCRDGRAAHRRDAHTTPHRSREWFRRAVRFNRPEGCDRYARGQKLLRRGTAAAELPERLGISQERWDEIVLTCAQRVVAWEVADA